MINMSTETKVCCECKKDLRIGERCDYYGEMYCKECVLEQLDKDGVVWVY